jgi:Mg-chelatase subunit ChlD
VQRCNNGADLVQQFFENVQSDLLVVKAYLGSILKSPVDTLYQNPGTPYPNFFGIAQVDPNEPPPPFTTSATGTKESSFYSVWFNKNDGVAANHPVVTMPSGHVDNIWRALWRASAKYQELYLGFPDQTYYTFPWRRLENLPSFQSTCARTGQTVVGYDPTCRLWYKLGTDNVNSPTPHFTQPYQDASTGLTVVTCAIAFNNAAGAFMGVAAADVTMSSVNDFIATEQLFTSGYAFIFDATKQLVVYPSLARDRVYSVVEKELGASPDGSELLMLDTLMNSVIAGNSSSPVQGVYKKGGADWLFTARSAGTTGMSVAFVAPYSEVLGAANSVSATLDTAIVVGVILIVLVLLVMIIISICVNNRLSRAIADPATQMAAVAKAVSENAKLSTDFADEKFATTEVKETSRNFVKLVQAVRFAKGFQDASTDMRLALAQLHEIEEMLTEAHNDVGLGAVYNNLALTILEVEGEDPRKAVEYARKAVAAAVDMRDALPEDDVEGKKAMTGVLCSRKITLGAALLSCNELAEAEDEVQKAMAIASHRGDAAHSIRARTVLASVLLKTKREDAARQLLVDCVRISSDAMHPANEEHIRTLQRAAEACATFESQARNFIASIQWSQYVLAVSPVIDRDIMRRAILNLSKCHEMLRNNTEAAVWKVEYANLTRAAGYVSTATGGRHVIFCVDVSGSMGGQPIMLVQEAMTSIVHNTLAEDDLVSLVTFQAYSTNVLSQVKLDALGKHNVTSVIAQLRCGGATAFYDGLNDAFACMTENATTWVIALTDGADTSSRVKPGALSALVKKQNIRLVVITVGRVKNENIIQSIVSNSSEGLVLKAKDIGQITAKFAQVAQMIERGHVALEML